MKININRGTFQQRKKKLNIKKGKQQRRLYIPSIQFFLKKIQSKQKSAKLKLNFINDKLGEKEEKMHTFFFTHLPLETLEAANEQKTKKEGKMSTF